MILQILNGHVTLPYTMGYNNAEQQRVTSWGHVTKAESKPISIAVAAAH